MRFVKAHADGNDFLLVPEAEAHGDPAALARRLCDRHRGIGADGLILFRERPGGASMRLLNADGSRAEVSGNGARCLAAWVLHARGEGSAPVIVETDAGAIAFEPLGRDGSRLRFRAAMTPPEGLELRDLDAAGRRLRVAVMRVGNPQCVALVGRDDMSLETLGALGPALSQHPAFPEGTNVEIATVEAPDRVRILIWERGVGPTASSGTGACAAAVAAIAYGGAGRNLEVLAPGGAQRVEWTPDGRLFLTGWAELLCEGRWLPR
ncbi:MAG TPA: diaminopimelate epimerase [Vicinamibacterales bacterium]|nr:diaminopimelate epimerase [Vicinamibacterales bacterium]